MKRSVSKKKYPGDQGTTNASQKYADQPLVKKIATPAVLSLFIFVVLVIHFWDLEKVPAGFYIDESSIGYNAYSILQTGADEHGVKMPLYFRAFGDYKNSVFIYSLVPLIAIFGPSPWTVRLTAALFGLGAAVLLGLIAKHSIGGKYAWTCGFALTALTPWLFTLSRVGFEVISFLCLLALAWWSWLRAIGTHSSLWFFITGLSWGLSIFSYSTARLMIPLLALTLVACYLSELRSATYRWIAAAIPFFVCGFLLLQWSISNPGSLTARFATISSWADDLDTLSVAIRMLSNYLNYFSPNFLFITGDSNLRHHTGRGGELFVFTFPALLCGLAFAWQNRSRPLERFTLAAFLLFPLAASLTKDPNHALRAANGIPFIMLLTLWGFRVLWQVVSSRRAVLTIFVLVGIFESVTYFYDYFADYPNRARAWYNAGLPAAVQAAMRQNTSGLYYSSFAVVDEKFDVNQPYIQFLFFGKLDPGVYQRKGLEAFQIYPYKRGTTLPKGSLLLLKSGQEVFTPSGQTIVLNNPDPLSQEAELMGEFRAPGDEARKAPAFQIFRVN